MLGLWTLLVGCATTATTTEDRCQLDLDTVSPDRGQPGDVVTVTGGPYLELRDNAVFVGGVRAEVIQVNGGTDDCLRCISCRLESECAACNETCEGEGLSEERVAECFSGDEAYCTTCSFELVFEVPEATPGPTEVWTVGQIGTSRALPFVVEAGPSDTGTTGLTDTNPTGTDTGMSDTGMSDTGASDTGTPDTGTPDTGTPDTGLPDTGTSMP